MGKDFLDDSEKDPFRDRLDFFGNFIGGGFWISRTSVILQGFWLNNLNCNGDFFDKKRFIQTLRRDAFDEDSPIRMKITEIKNDKIL